jgi:hypothetical protein
MFICTCAILISTLEWHKQGGAGVDGAPSDASRVDSAPAVGASQENKHRSPEPALLQ